MAYTLGHMVLESWQAGAADVYIKVNLVKVINAKNMASIYPEAFS